MNPPQEVFNPTIAHRTEGRYDPLVEVCGAGRHTKWVVEEGGDGRSRSRKDEEEQSDGMLND